MMHRHPVRAATVLDEDLQPVAAGLQCLRHFEHEGRRSAAMAADMLAVEEHERGVIGRAEGQQDALVDSRGLRVEPSRVPGPTLEIGPFGLQHVPARRHGNRLARLDLVIAGNRPLRRRRLVQREPLLAQALVEQVERHAPRPVERQERSARQGHERLRRGHAIGEGTRIVLVVEMRERIVRLLARHGRRRPVGPR